MLYDENKFEEESFWKKKGFYLSVCTALICLLAVGTVYYKMNYQTESNQNAEVAENSASSSDKEAGSVNAGNAAISQEMAEAGEDASSDKAEKENDDITQGGNNISGSFSQKDTADAAESQNDSKNSETDKQSAGAEKAKAKTASDAEGSDGKKSEDSDSSVAVMSNTGANGLTFNEEAGLLWPVEGDVIMKYSMNNTVYFKTLAQYRCNPAIEIAAEEGTKVSAAADGVVTKITENEETGKMVQMDIGGGYTVVYGQLKNIKVKKGQSVKEGETIGLVSAPTKYFAEEGSNLYFQVMQNGETVDPLLILR